MNKSIYLNSAISSMKKLLLSTLLLCICCAASKAQCPTDDITFSSQQELNDFAVNYPNCTQINGINISVGTSDSPSDISDLSPLNQIIILPNVTIQNNPLLTNLNGLDNLLFVANDLVIENNPMLTDLNVLSNVIGMGSLEIIDNPALSTLTGIGPLSELSVLIVRNNPLLADLQNFVNTERLNSLYIINNAALNDLSGLDSLRFVGSGVFQNNDALSSLNGLQNISNISSILKITSNQSLTDLSDLQNIVNINRLEIVSNQNLTSLSDLENLSTVEEIIIDENNILNDISGLGNIDHNELDSLRITNNPQLSTCNIESICNYLNTSDIHDIANNSTDCTSAEVVYVNCGFSFPTCPLSGDIRLSTQQDIDSFAATFPDCTVLQNLRIEYEDTLFPITDLNPLNKIDSITYRLNIIGTDLTNLNGLENLTSVGELGIGRNSMLTDLSALTNLTNVWGLSIFSNDILNDLYGLQYIDPNTIGVLFIAGNVSLSACSTWNICHYLMSGGGFIPSTIRDNAPRCNSPSEVTFNCYLPVELTRFEAQAQSVSILLKWQTASETNNQGFEVQRSKDGINWQKIAWEQGAGTSTTTQNYHYNDTQPLSDINYYRLKQIDIKGDISYSDIVNVVYKSLGFSVFPVPSKEEITLQLESNQSTIEIHITNIIGKVIHSQDLHTSGGVNHLTFDISDYAKGVYFLTINNGDKNGTQRFVKH